MRWSWTAEAYIAEELGDEYLRSAQEKTERREITREMAEQRKRLPHSGLAFDEGAIPRPLTAEQRQATVEAMRRKQAENAKRDEDLEKRKRAIVYTDCVDDLGQIQEVELRAVP